MSVHIPLIFHTRLIVLRIIPNTGKLTKVFLEDTQIPFQTCVKLLSGG